MGVAQPPLCCVLSQSSVDYTGSQALLGIDHSTGGIHTLVCTPLVCTLLMGRFVVECFNAMMETFVYNIH